MPTRDLSPDELLSTTRSVRRRLDLTRPVSRETLEQCVALAVQAPTSTNTQNWHFIIVRDAQRRTRLAEYYRAAWMAYNDGRAPDEPRAGESRAQASSRYLAANIHRVPVHVVPCIEGRPEGLNAADLAALYGSIIQAGWSFQLAARARGLGSVWTTHHLEHEREAARVLGVPFDAVTQVGLIPVAHTIGSVFRPAHRRPLASVLHWDAW